MTTAVAAYTLALLTTDVQALIGDVNGTRYSTVMLNDAINYAIKQIATLRNYTYVEKTLSLSIPTSGSYTGQYTFPMVVTGAGAYNHMDYITIKKAMIGSVGAGSPWDLRSLLDSSVAYEDAKNPKWRTTFGYPMRWVMADGSTIMTVPSVNTELPGCPNPFTMTIGYIQQPALLSDAADTVDSRIPYTVQQYLKYCAASWLLSLDNTDTQSLSTSKIYMDRFLSLIGE